MISSRVSGVLLGSRSAAAVGRLGNNYILAYPEGNGWVRHSLKRFVGRGSDGPRKTGGVHCISGVSFGVDVLGAPSKEMSNTSSAWETATSFAPTGAGAKFIGTYHGNQGQASLNVYVDGEILTLTDGQVVYGRGVRVSTSGVLTHPLINNQTVANYSYDYRAVSSGIEIDASVVWIVSGKVFAAYAMMPVDGVNVSGGFHTGMTDTSASPPVRALPDLGDRDYGVGLAASTSWVWGDEWFAVHYLSNATEWKAGGVDNRGTVVESRNISSGTSIIKVYNPRTKSLAGESVVAGTTHRYVAHVKFGKIVSNPSLW